MRHIFMIGIVCAANTVFAQQKQERIRQTDSLLASRRFVFEARLMQPMYANQQIISGNGYEVRVTVDSVTASLPYWGQAYVAPRDPSEGGIRLSTKKFDYNMKVLKRGMRQVTLSFMEAGDVQRMYFTISPEGNATLQILMMTRQSISFTGDIIAAD